MTTPLWCLMVLAILPNLLAGLGGFLRGKELGSMDNNHPRLQAGQLSEGPAARALAAQYNAWEALGFFTATLVIALFAGADAGALATASLVFLAARILHAVFYLMAIATARSLVQFVGFFTCFYIFYLAATA